MRLASLCGVEFRSRLLTAKNQAAIHRDQALRWRSELPAGGHGLPEDVANARAAVAPEVGDRPGVRRPAAGQPRQLDIALALAHKAPAGLNADEVAVGTDPEQPGRVVGRPARLGRLRAVRAEIVKVEFLNEGVHDVHRAVLGNEVVRTPGQQSDLASLLSLDESLHEQPPHRVASIQASNASSHLDPQGSFGTAECKVGNVEFS
jgi:hypothetical protein